MEDGPIIITLIVGCIFTPIGIALIGLSEHISVMIGRVNLEMVAGFVVLATGIGCLIVASIIVFGNRSNYS